MATLSDTRTLVRQAISQTDSSASDFSDSELNGFIDMGVRFLGALVKKPLKRTTFQVVADTASYAIGTYASDLVIPTKAYFGDPSIPGDVRPLRIIPEEELAEVSPAWLDTSSSSQGRPAFLIKDGVNLLLHPRPTSAEAATGKKVHLSYVYQPASLTNDATSLDLPAIYHDLVARYAAHLCYLGKLNNSEKAIELKGLVIADAKKLEGLIVKDSESPGFHWGSTVDPDVDTGMGYLAR